MYYSLWCIRVRDRLSEQTLVLSSVRYGAGRGGFSLARPHPYTGPGGYVSGNPRPAPVRGPPAIIPWTGPRLLPPILNGDPSGVWVGRGPERGQGHGMPKKTPRPSALSGAGRGKGPGARVFQGPVRPVTNSSAEFISPISDISSDLNWCTIGYCSQRVEIQVHPVVMNLTLPHSLSQTILPHLCKLHRNTPQPFRFWMFLDLMSI